MFLLPIVYSVLVYYISNASGSDSRPGYEYREQVRGWLKLHQRPASWLAARVSCHMEGAFLASPRSPEFSTAIQSVLSGTSQGPRAIQMLFSGRLAMSLEPSGMAWLERCGVFYANGSEGEVDCKQLLPYVCYAPASEVASSPAPTIAPITVSTIDPVPEAICGDKSLGFELNNQTGNCYKFHTAAATALNAEVTCAKGGAHLASPNNHAERRALIQLFERNPWETVQNSVYRDVILTGIHGKDGVWTTADGQSIDEYMQEEWHVGLPSLNQDHLNHLYMYKDGSVQSLSGLSTAPFICEKRAASRT